MPEPRNLPLFRWGEDLRRLRSARRRAGLRLAATAAAATAVTALLFTLFWPSRPAVVWNRSASSPEGLYRVTSASNVVAGDLVVAWLPDAARDLAARRGYLPANVPLLKRAAAVAGDRVCAAGEAVFVNGTLEVLRRREDAAGRPMPWWTGCADLSEGDLFLVAPVSGSFDGRYFGVTRAGQVIGRARPVWLW